MKPVVKTHTISCVDVPSELVPALLELVTDAYVKLANEQERAKLRISDLEFRNGELSERSKYLESENARLTASVEKF